MKNVVTTIIVILFLFGFADLRGKLKESYFVPSSTPTNEITALEKEFLGKLKLYDRAYTQWIKQGKSAPELWHYLASEVFGKYVKMECNNDREAAFVLRGMLASGVCYLYESKAYMQKGVHFKPQALRAYDVGIEILEQVINIGRKNPAIHYLPDYSMIPIMDPNRKSRFIMHPYAGYETLLVGVEDRRNNTFFRFPKPITNKTLQNVDPNQFFDLKLIQFRQLGWLDSCTSEKNFENKNRKVFKQGSTVETAEYMLYEFCPWGYGVYTTLRDAGLTRQLDWRILRPFAGKHVLPMSEISLAKPFLIPNHIRQEMAMIVGNGQSGFLGLNQTIPIRWEWIEKKPTYVLKFISPTVMERTRSDDQFSKAMNFMTMTFGGPIDWLVEATLGKLLKRIESDYGKNGVIYQASWLLVQGNDKGFVSTSFIDQHELSGLTLFKKIVGVGFTALEDFLTKNMYEGVDPQLFSQGKSYNKKPIPPIMIRADVLGFQKVPNEEYGRTIQAVRHYLFNPSAVACKTPDIPYNLSKGLLTPAFRKDQYLKEQWANNPSATEIIRAKAWERLPSPFGTRDYVNDFSPPLQILNIQLPKKEFDKWDKTRPKNDLLYVQLWQKSLNGKPRLIINERIHDPKIRLTIYNTHSPKGKSGFISANTRYRSATYKKQITTQRMHPSTYRYFGGNDNPQRAVKNLALEINNRLSGCYTLMITRGKNGAKIVEYPIVVSVGRRGARLHLSGKIRTLSNGAVVCDIKLFPRGSNTPIPLEANYDHLFPRNLIVYNSLGNYLDQRKKSKVERVSLSAGETTFLCKGFLTGFPLQTGYHKILFTLGKQQFVAWALVQHPYASARFECTIPIPEGTHTLLISANRFNSSKLIISRKTNTYNKKELIRANNFYQKDLMQYRKNPSASQKRWLASSTLRLGIALHKDGQEKEAYRLCLQAKKLNPESVLNSYVFSTICFHVKDSKNMLNSTMYQIQQLKKRCGKTKKRSSSNSYVNQIVIRYKHLIRRWVSLEGDPKIARKLTVQMVQYLKWNKTSFDPENDLSICLGPEKRRANP